MNFGLIARFLFESANEFKKYLIFFRLYSFVFVIFIMNFAISQIAEASEQATTEESKNKVSS